MLRQPGGNNDQKRQIGKNSPGLSETKRDNGKKESTNAKHGGIDFKNLQENSRRTGRRNMDFEVRSRLCVRATTIIKTSNGPLHIRGGNFTGYYRFLKRFYGLADISTDHFSREN